MSNPFSGRMMPITLLVVIVLALQVHVAGQRPGRSWRDDRDRRGDALMSRCGV